MARRRTRRKAKVGGPVEGVGRHEAVVLLEALQRLGHVTVGHLRQARHAIVVEAQEVAARLARLRDTAVHVVTRKGPQAASVRPGRKSSSKRKRKTAPVSAKRMKAMQLQARYLRALVAIPKKQRGKYKTMIGKIGKEATIRKMEAAAKK